MLAANSTPDNTAPPMSPDTSDVCYGHPHPPAAPVEFMAVKKDQITGLSTHDIRFPTSLELDGSDAMNPDPDYSAAYVVIHTDANDGLEGHGFAFTIGRGNDVQVRAIQAIQPFLAGRPLDDTLDDLGGMWRILVHDSQLRWLGPEKGVVHMAISAVVNALWDLKAKRAGRPLWRLLAEMTPDQLVDLVDFRYLTDALTPDEARDILRRAEPGRAERMEYLLGHGYPAFTTCPGGGGDGGGERSRRRWVGWGF
jgi:L-fuconate dehydratase